jgi:hypothetical protein
MQKGFRSWNPTQRGTALRRGEAESDADPQDIEFGGEITRLGALRVGGLKTAVLLRFGHGPRD